MHLACRLLTLWMAFLLIRPVLRARCILQQLQLAMA
jgi:hypothetical protein